MGEKPEHREVKYLSQGHTGKHAYGQHLSTVSLTTQSPLTLQATLLSLCHLNILLGITFSDWISRSFL